MERQNLNELQTLFSVNNMLSEITRGRTKELIKDASSLELAKNTFISHWAANDLWRETLEATCEVYDIPVLLPLIPRRCQIQVTPKTHIARILYVFSPNITYMKLALATNKKDHSSIINLLTSFEDQLSISKSYRETHRRILEKLVGKIPHLLNTTIYLNNVYRFYTPNTEKNIYNHDEYTLLYYAQMGSSVIRPIAVPEIPRNRANNSQRETELSGISG
jgi:hypothetical protein